MNHFNYKEESFKPVLPFMFFARLAILLQVLVRLVQVFQPLLHRQELWRIIVVVQ
jgi:hypothetical protein